MITICESNRFFSTLQHIGSNIKKTLWGYKEEGGIGWQYEHVKEQIKKLKQQLAKATHPIERQELEEKIRELEDKASNLAKQIDELLKNAPTASINYTPEKYHYGVIPKAAYHVRRAAEEHPVAAGIGGAVAAGLGALAARKLWKRRQQRKQQGR